MCMAVLLKCVCMCVCVAGAMQIILMDLEEAKKTLQGIAANGVANKVMHVCYVRVCVCAIDPIGAVQ